MNLLKVPVLDGEDNEYVYVNPNKIVKIRRTSGGGTMIICDDEQYVETGETIDEVAMALRNL